MCRTLIKTHNFVTFCKFLIQLGVHNTYDKALPYENYARNQPLIPVSHELNEPIFEWTDNKTLLTGAFPDNFLFG
jgi:hypothetical protein